MRRRALRSLVLCVSIACPAAAQDTKPKPFDVSFGPQDNGTFGAVLKGSHYKSLRRTPSSQQSGQLVSLFAGVEVDGSWNSAQDARNNVSLALRPSIALQTITPKTIDGQVVPTTAGPWLHAFVDARQRFGDLDATQRVNQLILGGGLELRFVRFAKWYSQAADIGREDNPPMVAIGYYGVVRNHDGEALPSDITTNALQARASSKITLPVCTKEKRTVAPSPNDAFGGEETIYNCPWGFSGEVIGTKLTSGPDQDLDFKVDVGVFYDTGGKFKPMLRYRTGEEHGLEYDKQFILGLLWQLPI